jgi:hypothetical protein
MVEEKETLKCLMLRVVNETQQMKESQNGLASVLKGKSRSS